MSFVGEMRIEFSSGRAAIIYAPGGNVLRARRATVRWDDRLRHGPVGWWLMVEAHMDEPEQHVILTTDGEVDCYEAAGLAVAELARNHPA